MSLGRTAEVRPCDGGTLSRLRIDAHWLFLRSTLRKFASRMSVNRRFHLLKHRGFRFATTPRGDKEQDMTSNAIHTLTTRERVVYGTATALVVSVMPFNIFNFIFNDHFPFPNGPEGAFVHLGFSFWERQGAAQRARAGSDPLRGRFDHGGAPVAQ
jgi:hypothetical protein